MATGEKPPVAVHGRSQGRRVLPSDGVRGRHRPIIAAFAKILRWNRAQQNFKSPGGFRTVLKLRSRYAGGEMEKMDLTRVHKKIEEAQFFLGKMTEQERQISGDKQPFDYFLSAFLYAARTVDYRLRHEQGAVYRPWRTDWDAGSTAEQRRLMKFIADDRAEEVHESGSRREVGQEGVKFGIGEHQLPDGSTLRVSGIPKVLSGIDPAVVAYKPTYSYTIDGTERKVTEACIEHLGLLRQMVTEFETHQQP
jgi:hypothetical protein